MALTNSSRLADFGSGIGTAGAIIQVDNANQRVGIGTINPQTTLQVVGIVSATSFSGNVTGTATGLSGSPNITVGFITATEFDISGSSNTLNAGGLSVGIATVTTLSATTITATTYNGIPATSDWRDASLFS